MSRHINPRLQNEKDGKPIVGGQAYFGVANQDPKLNPIIIYSDENLTVPILNPQSTDDQGRISNRVFMAESQYSYLLEDNLGNQQLLEPSLEPLNTIALVTADIDLNGFKIVDAADATANNEYATLGQNNKLYAQTVNTAGTSAPDAIVVNLPVPIDTLDDGFAIRVNILHGANTIGNPTLKIDTFSAKTIYRDSNSNVHQDDTVGNNNHCVFVYSAELDKFQIINPFIVTNSSFFNNTINGGRLINGSVTQTQMAANSVGFNEFIDGASQTIVGRNSAGAGPMEFLDIPTLSNMLGLGELAFLNKFTGDANSLGDPLPLTLEIPVSIGNPVKILVYNDISTTDSLESFSFPGGGAIFNGDPFIFTLRTDAGAGNILPVVSTLSTGFSIDRDAAISGSVPFIYFAIGPGFP